MSTANCVLMKSLPYRPGYDDLVTESVTEDVSGSTEEDEKGATAKTSIAGPNPYSKHNDIIILDKYSVITIFLS